MSLREAFLQAIAANEDDTVVRLVFSDWLDEHDEHEEAERQRNWPEAKRWLDSICKKHNSGCRKGEEFTYDQLLEFGRNVSAMSNVRVEVDSHIPDSGHIVIAIRDQIPEFWKAWSIITGLPLTPNVEQKYYYSSGFCCATEIYGDTHLAGPIPEEIIRAEEDRARLRQWEEEEQQQELEALEDRARLRQQEELKDHQQQRFDMIQDELEKDRP